MPSSPQLSCSGSKGTLRMTWWWILSLCCAVIRGFTGKKQNIADHRQIFICILKRNMNKQVCLVFLSQVSSFDGHCPTHAKWLPAGLKSLLTLSPEGDCWFWSAEPVSLKPRCTWTARYTWGHKRGAEECPSSCAGIFTGKYTNIC